MSEETKRSPRHAPDYALHRYVAEANDTLPETVRAHGMNMHGFQNAHVQVVPDTNNPDPSIKILFWSEAAGAFIDDHSALAFAGKGAGVPYEVTVACNGRVMFVAVVGGMSAGMDCRIYVSGFNDRRK
jgi:hypothetical protein